ncbi:MAG: OmpH family outer membrane protein [Firmicutes bacterium]|nr:OmpH family outer membrane protein [Bacillota bacterium]
MAKWWQLTAVGVLGLVLGLAFGLWGPFRGMRAAVVDLDRVFKESALAQEYQKKLDAEAKAREAAMAKITDTKERLAKAEEYRQELTELQQKYRNEVLTALDKVLAELARRRGLEVVYVRGAAVRYAGIDLTEEAIRRLK